MESQGDSFDEDVFDDGLCNVQTTLFVKKNANLFSEDNGCMHPSYPVTTTTANRYYITPSLDYTWTGRYTVDLWSFTVSVHVCTDGYVSRHVLPTPRLWPELFQDTQSPQHEEEFAKLVPLRDARGFLLEMSSLELG